MVCTVWWISLTADWWLDRLMNQFGCWSIGGYISWWISLIADHWWLTGWWISLVVVWWMVSVVDEQVSLSLDWWSQGLLLHWWSHRLMDQFGCCLIDGYRNWWISSVVAPLMVTHIDGSVWLLFDWWLPQLMDQLSCWSTDGYTNWHIILHYFLNGYTNSLTISDLVP